MQEGRGGAVCEWACSPRHHPPLCVREGEAGEEGEGRQLGGEQGEEQGESRGKM